MSNGLAASNFAPPVGAVPGRGPTGGALECRAPSGAAPLASFNPAKRHAVAFRSRRGRTPQQDGCPAEGTLRGALRCFLSARTFIPRETATAAAAATAAPVRTDRRGPWGQRGHPGTSGVLSNPFFRDGASEVSAGRVVDEHCFGRRGRVREAPRPPEPPRQREQRRGRDKFRLWTLSEVGYMTRKIEYTRAIWVCEARLNGSQFAEVSVLQSFGRGAEQRPGRGPGKRFAAPMSALRRVLWLSSFLRRRRSSTPCLHSWTLTAGRTCLRCSISTRSLGSRWCSSTL